MMGSVRGGRREDKERKRERKCRYAFLGSRPRLRPASTKGRQQSRGRSRRKAVESTRQGFLRHEPSFGPEHDRVVRQKPDLVRGCCKSGVPRTLGIVRFGRDQFFRRARAPYSSLRKSTCGDRPNRSGRIGGSATNMMKIGARKERRMESDANLKCKQCVGTAAFLR